MSLSSKNIKRSGSIKWRSNYSYSISTTCGWNRPQNELLPYIFAHSKEHSPSALPTTLNLLMENLDVMRMQLKRSTFCSDFEHLSVAPRTLNSCGMMADQIKGYFWRTACCNLIPLVHRIDHKFGPKSSIVVKRPPLRSALKRRTESRIMSFQESRIKT